MVLRQLQRLLTLPPDVSLEVADRRAGGKDELVRHAAAFLLPVGGSVIVLRDLDDFTPDQAVEWFEGQLRVEFGPKVPGLTLRRVDAVGPQPAVYALSDGTHSGWAALVLVGSPPAQALVTEYGIERFAVDDYLLLLAKDEATYAGMSEHREVGFGVAFRKLKRFAELMRENQVAVCDSKRLLKLLQGITGFRASPATYAERLIEGARGAHGDHWLRQHFNPLAEAMEAAVRALAARWATGGG
ncbi:MAG: hypothetical protein HY906_23410 [Deltaproteobacteria bacterium]|nr:hypothetical protein [Deltaproteobacteria bacterium]